jgi:SOS-response transcriptional repressor LexA
MSDFGIVRERISQRLEELSLTANAASEQAGIDRSILRKFMNGSVKELREHNLKAIAKGLRVTPQWLLGETEDKGESEEGFAPNQRDVPILGIVESGAFRPLDWFDQADLGFIHNGYDLNFAGESQFGYVVRGDQMDKAGIYDGDEIVCVDPWDVAVQIGDGDWVVVQVKTIGDTPTRELTVREFHVVGNQIQLLPRSSSRMHKTYDLPLDADLQDGPISIIGAITSVIRKRPLKIGARSGLKVLQERAPKPREDRDDNGQDNSLRRNVGRMLSSALAVTACKMLMMGNAVNDSASALGIHIPGDVIFFVY